MTNKCMWLLGLSGAGKTTLANHLSSSLNEKNIKNIILDGDILRSGLNSNLGFTDEDRIENVRRVAEVAKLFLSEGYWVIVALITPFEIMRKKNQEIIGERYFEIFVDTPIEICEERDPKGLYSKVAQKQINNFTGKDSPFEMPKSPNLVVKTSDRSIEECANEIKESIFSDKL